MTRPAGLGSAGPCALALGLLLTAYPVLAEPEPAPAAEASAHLKPFRPLLGTWKAWVDPEIESVP